MTGLLSLELAEGVALVTLQRPEKRNALSIDLRLELADAFGRLADDDEVGCAVLTGAGSAFCSGMDTTQFGGDRANKERLVESSIAAFGTVARFPKPLVGAINGPAIAGGFVLALYCDLRVASETAAFGFPELPRGIPPSYAAARAALPEPLARELVLTGRAINASEARAAGVVSEVVPFADVVLRALDVARGIAAKPRATLREVKRRILLDAEHLRGHLVEDEERAFREALLRDDPGDSAA
jgi:enoyl-CoA hydratase/carnithine racemase